MFKNRTRRTPPTVSLAERIDTALALPFSYAGRAACLGAAAGWLLYSLLIAGTMTASAVQHAVEGDSTLGLIGHAIGWLMFALVAYGVQGAVAGAVIGALVGLVAGAIAACGNALPSCRFFPRCAGA